jgi:HTH-like domain
VAERIAEIHEVTRGTYGWPRVRAKLRREGLHISREPVGRIMRQWELIGRRSAVNPHHPSDPEAVALDRRKRAFDQGRGVREHGGAGQFVTSEQATIQSLTVTEQD